VIRVEHSVVIGRPQADVFAYLADPRNLPDWQASVLEARSHGPIESGALFTEVRRVLGKRVESLIEVVEYERERRLTVRSSSGPVAFRVTHSLEPTDGGTRLSVAVEGEPGGFARLGAPILVRMLRRELEADFARLKELLESRS
jgi:carbon monoxide dehydrogenase subunit G